MIPLGVCLPFLVRQGRGGTIRVSLAMTIGDEQTDGLARRSHPGARIGRLGGKLRRSCRHLVNAAPPYQSAPSRRAAR